MYCSHFNLHREPFNNTPDPAFYFSTPEHEEALATLQYAVEQRKGFVLLTGSIGAGKTLIGRLFQRQIEHDARTAVINQTHLNGGQLLAAICRELGVECRVDADTVEMVHKLQDFLLEEFAHDRTVVVLLDEAQNLPHESFEQLRMLGNLEADDAKLLQVCILGQPELRERFRQTNMRQLDQRLFCRFHLSPLTREQTRAYIHHRMTVAGAGDREIFTAAALEKIYQATRGTPRLINQLCDNALLTAYGRGDQQVDEDVIVHVLAREATGPDEATAAAADAAADQKIEQIYGARPVLVESVIEDVEPAPRAERVAVYTPLPVQACRVEAGARHAQDQLKVMLESALTNSNTAREWADHYHHEMRPILDDLTARCRSLQEQIEEVGHAAAPVDELEEMRQMHLREVTRVLSEVGRQRRELENLISQAAERQASEQNRLRELLTAAAVTRDDLGRLRQEVREQIEAGTGRTTLSLQQHHDQVTALLNQMRERCQILDTNLQKTRSGMDGVRAEMFERLSAELQNVTRELEARTGAMVSPAELAAVRQQTDARIDQLNSALAAQDRKLTHQSDQLATVQDRLEREASDIRRTIANLPEEVEKIRRKHAHAIFRVLRRLQEQSHELEQLRQTSEAQARLRAEQQAAPVDETALAELNDRVERQTRRLRRLRMMLTAHEESIDSRLSRLSDEFASQADLTDLRQEYEERTARLLETVQQNRRHIEKLMADIERERLLTREYNEVPEADVVNLHPAAVEDLFRQIAEQADNLNELRNQWLESEAGVADQITRMAEHCATRHELDVLRTTHESRLKELSQSLQEQRDRSEAALHDAAERTQSALQDLLKRHSEHDAGLKTLTATAATREQVAQAIQQQQKEAARLENEIQQARNALHEQMTRLAGRHEDGLADLLRQVREARETVDAQIREVQIQAAALNARVDALTTTAGQQHEAIEALRLEQADSQQTFRAALESRQHELTALQHKTQTWRDEVQSRLDHLAAAMTDLSNRDADDDIARQQIDALRAEVTQARQELTAAIRAATERCEQAHQTIEDMSVRYASRMEIDDLRRRVVSRLRELRTRHRRVQQHHDETVRSLQERLSATTQRIQAIETREREAAVRVNVSPEAMHELAEMIEMARKERDALKAEREQIAAQRQALAEDLAQARQADQAVQQAVAEGRELLAGWSENAAAVQTQSERLRASAGTTVDILQAMQKCQQAIDNRLSTGKWREELNRGEQVATRLEQIMIQAQMIHRQLVTAMTDFEHCRGQVEDWTKMRADVQRSITQLTTLLHAANMSAKRVEQTIQSRKQILSAIARGTAGLAKIIESAREAEEGTVETHSASKPETVRPMQWQTLRTVHPQAC